MKHERRPRSGFWGCGRFVFLPLGLGAAIAQLPACDKPAAAAPGPIHTVRGRVIGLPVAGDPSTAFTLHHEDIPEWVRPDGEKGMHAMKMPFPVGKGVSLEGLQVGDAVEVNVRQYTGGPLPYEVVELRKLPHDAALNLP